MTHHSRVRLRLVAPRVGPVRATAWCAPTQGHVALKLVELVSAGNLFRVWGVFHSGP
jgi:hypothetical protein